MDVLTTHDRLDEMTRIFFILTKILDLNPTLKPLRRVCRPFMPHLRMEDTRFKKKKKKKVRCFNKAIMETLSILIQMHHKLTVKHLICLHGFQWYCGPYSPG